jgi:hypothetical protein
MEISSKNHYSISAQANQLQRNLALTRTRAVGIPSRSQEEKLGYIVDRTISPFLVMNHGYDPSQKIMVWSHWETELGERLCERTGVARWCICLIKISAISKVTNFILQHTLEPAFFLTTRFHREETKRTSGMGQRGK